MMEILFNMNEFSKRKKVLSTYQSDDFVEESNKIISEYYDSLVKYGVEKKRKNMLILPEDRPFKYVIPISYLNYVMWINEVY